MSLKTKTPKTIKILYWVYCETIRGKKATAFGSFNGNFDTSFRTHVSILKTKHGINLKRKSAIRKANREWHKVYWIGKEDIKKAKVLLSFYGLIESETLTAEAD